MASLKKTILRTIATLAVVFSGIQLERYIPDSHPLILLGALILGIFLLEWTQ